eukprot:802066-Pleurochrysis_carterae.AAC.1
MRALPTHGTERAHAFKTATACVPLLVAALACAQSAGDDVPTEVNALVLDGQVPPWSCFSLWFDALFWKLLMLCDPFQPLPTFVHLLANFLRSAAITFLSLSMRGSV